MIEIENITNPIIVRILKALHEESNNPILTFGDYFLKKDIKAGQQGLVLKAKNQINKEFAIKFYCPSDTSIEIIRKGVHRFKQEVKITAELSHKNLVRIFSGGIAYWQNESWNVNYGFDSEYKENDPNNILFYVMDFITGNDLTDIFPFLIKENKKEDNISLTDKDKRRYFENLIKHVSKGINCYNQTNIYHRDLKPGNIIYSHSDENFIIVDFGFCEPITPLYKKEYLTLTEYIDMPSVYSGHYEKYDMGQFSRMLLDILEKIKSSYDENRYKGLEAVLRKGCDDNLSKRYDNILSFYKAAKAYFVETTGWNFAAKLHHYLTEENFGEFNRSINIPVSRNVPIFEAITKIIDTPEFQRLRGVKQLGPTNFVFPGATHTRFEHSLGVYNLSLKYLEQIIDSKEFRSICPDVEQSIKVITLSCLLHDIGHYPYSHWIEEIGEFENSEELEKHEERAERIISGSTICDIIYSDWKIDCEEIYDIIKPKSSNSFASSFINSIIDCDKLDY
jgi:serine/threonine protein kinase